MRSLLSRTLLTLLCAVAMLAAGLPLCGQAQEADEGLEGVLGDIGSASVVEEGDATTGSIFGRVFDAESGTPLSGASVILNYPDPGDGSDPRQEVAVTELDGSYLFPAVPEGVYELTFIKAGYRASTLTGLEVQAGEEATGDFPIPPVATDSASGEVLELDAFVVDVAVVDEMMASLELRMESDQLLNIMSAEDLSRYAASDVADALKRISGVNVIEGQFAIIQGLEERYSSTTFNGAPIPSPDPDRQSVQLDLFPSDVVSNLVVAKTFGPEQPGNSAGGSIDILTLDYPETLQLSLWGGTGWNDNATDRFVSYEESTPLGSESDDFLEREYGASLGGRATLLGRELRFRGVFNDEVDYETARGWQEERQPDRARVRNRRGTITVLETGDLSTGNLTLSGGLFDYSEFHQTDQVTGFAALGFDLDPDGNHKIDFTWLYTEKDDRNVEYFENGFLPNLDYGPLLAKAQLSGFDSVTLNDMEEEVVKSSKIAAFRTDGGANRGHVFYTIFEGAENFRRERELSVYQLNGDHSFPWLDDLKLRWAGNYATTSLSQSSFGTRWFFEPDDPQAQIPAAAPVFDVALLGPGQWALNETQTFDGNEIDETQLFGRTDLEYERQLLEGFDLTLTAGGWYEDAERDVDSQLLFNAGGGATDNVVRFGATPQDAASGLLSDLGLGTQDTTRLATNESSRTIQALYGGLKASFWERLDLLAGLRLEDIFIESINDPFQDPPFPDGSPNIAPSRYLLFDRYDNPNLVFESAAPSPGSPEALAKIHNDQILGIAVPVDPATGFVDILTDDELRPLINGEIDERYLLPSFGLSFRMPWVEGLTLRGAYSQTVARPSFREMGYYISTEPGTDDKIIGNPQLDVSEVEGWDARVEYLFGDLGDLVAGSFFVKEIEDPIESILISDQATFSGEANFQTFFNNPTTADLLGFEVETRLHLGLFGLLGPLSDFMDNFSIGGNYTWIDAEVDRSSFELGRPADYFGVADGDPEVFTGLASKRRLFNQPRWIANADVSFQHPDLGTRVTLAWFGISDVLTTVGGATLLQPGNAVEEYTLDRYDDSYTQLDLILSQDFHLPWQLGTLTFKSSIKNLTDSKRKVIYDRGQLYGADVAERAYRVGRDYSFALKFTYDFGL